MYFLVDDVSHWKKKKDYSYIDIEITTLRKKCFKFEVVQNTFLSTELAGIAAFVFALFHSATVYTAGEPSKSAMTKVIKMLFDALTTYA